MTNYFSFDDTINLLFYIYGAIWLHQCCQKFGKIRNIQEMTQKKCTLEWMTKTAAWGREPALINYMRCLHVVPLIRQIYDFSRPKKSSWRKFFSFLNSQWGRIFPLPCDFTIFWKPLILKLLRFFSWQQPNCCAALTVFLSTYPLFFKNPKGRAVPKVF